MNNWITEKLNIQKNKAKISTVNQTLIKNYLNVNKLRFEPIYCFNELEHIVIGDNKRQARIHFRKELDYKGNVYFETILTIADFL